VTRQVQAVRFWVHTSTRHSRPFPLFCSPRVRNGKGQPPCICMSELSDKGGETGRACVHTGPERRHSKPERRERSSNRAGRGRGPGSLSLKTLEAVRHSGSPRPPRPMMNPSTTIPPASNWRATETLRAGPAVSCGAVRWLSKQPATAGGMAVPDYRQPSPRAPPRARPARLTSDQVVPVRRRRP
jgi:hypothetical protein